MMNNDKKRDLISIADLSQEEISGLFAEAAALKAGKAAGPDRPLAGKTLAMIFQKPSTRTIVSFSVGMVQLGGHPLVLNYQELQMKRGESIADTARTLSLYADAVMVRANRHEDVCELARHASIPVINGLSDKEHPCQALADFLAIQEHKKLKSAAGLRGVKLAYLGDGNNVAHSLILGAAILGMEIAVSSPKRYEPEKEFIEKGNALAAKSGGKIIIEPDPEAAVRGADALYTDVWASMGKEDEREHRKQVFGPYQLNAGLLALAKPDAVVMHCLPAHRGEEITDEVLDGPRSIVFPQAANRLHVQKAILLRLLSKN